MYYYYYKYNNAFFSSSPSFHQFNVLILFIFIVGRKEHRGKVCCMDWQGIDIVHNPSSWYIQARDEWFFFTVDWPFVIKNITSDIGVYRKWRWLCRFNIAQLLLLGSNTKCLSPANHGLQVYTENGMETRAFEMNQLNSIGFPTAREIQIEVDVLGSSFNVIIKCSAIDYMSSICVCIMLRPIWNMKETYWSWCLWSIAFYII